MFKRKLSVVAIAVGSMASLFALDPPQHDRADLMNVIADQGDTVDALCWRYYGRTEGMVEAVLEANAGLADYGAVIPIGTVVFMPDIATVETKAPLVQLFD